MEDVIANKTKWSGIAQALLAAFCFGAEPVIAKLFFQQGGSPLLLNFGRLWIMLPILAIFVIGVRRLELQPARYIRPGLVIGVLYALLMSVLYYTFLFIPVPVGISIIFIYPVLLGLLGILLKRQPAQFSFMVLLLVAFSGTLLVVSPDYSGLNGIGVVLAVLGALTVTLYLFVSGEYMAKQGLNGELLAFYMIGVAALLYSVLAGITSVDISGLSPQAYLILLCAGLVGSIGQVSLFEAVRKLSSSGVGIYMNFEIIVAVGLAALVLGETLQILQYLGTVLILGAVLLAAFWHRSERPAGEPEPL